MKTTIRQSPLSADPRDKSGPAFKAMMELEPNSGAIHLHGRKHVHLRHALGWTIRAISGKVWITQDYDLRDIVLEPGQSFTLDRNSDALLAPLDEADILLERHAVATKSGPTKERVYPAISFVRALLA